LFGGQAASPVKPDCHHAAERCFVAGQGRYPMSDFQETLYEGYGQRFQVDKLLHEMRTEHQHLVIFENPRMGRVMALDGVIQTSEADEFIYHEMLAHVPIL